MGFLWSYMAFMVFCGNKLSFLKVADPNSFGFVILGIVYSNSGCHNIFISFTRMTSDLDLIQFVALVIAWILGYEGIDRLYG